MEPNASSYSSRSFVEIAMEVHKVVPPPHISTIHKLKTRLKETFFPDDPLRQFKGQPLAKKWLLGAQYVFPILKWGPSYNLTLFKSDIISGLTIASLAIPQIQALFLLLYMLCLEAQEILQLGFIIDFLSKATLIGFMAGAAIIVSLQQLKSLLGITHFTKKMGLVPVMSSVFHNTKEYPAEWDVCKIAEHEKTKAILGVSWCPSCVSHPLDLAGLCTQSSTPWYHCRAFSRSAVNHNAGAKTAVSNIIMAMTVMVTLLFLMPLFQYTPNVVLGAIIVTAVVGLIDLPAAYQIWKIDKYDFIVMLCAFLGVIFISVQEGLAIAVGLCIFKVLLQITRPKTVMLGNMPGTNIYRNLHHYKEASKIPGFLILSIEAPINFANTTYLNDRWIEDYKEEEEEEPKKHSGLRFVILDLSAVSAIDTSGVSFIKDLRKALEMKGLEAINPIGEVMEKLQRADETRDFMRPDFLFLTVGEAVAFLMSTVKGQSLNHV
ncbi:hypothetical protein RJ639_044898 [Escallonia herrerae]|uniref:STAS domain-containing protein n=1 Tax=Escallonia herrerae TaxID=1293975 RepID=A0AA88WBD7_9ASTE|nr:hypothetical protein RJ639_044898 [Escallonia herrerae]